MATFWGDILRILAHTGFQTAGGIGKELVSGYLKPGVEAKEAYLKSLIPTIATAPEPQAEAAAKTFEKATGQKQPRYLAQGFIPEGVAPSPTSLMSLTDVNKAREGSPYGAFDVGTVEKLVRPLPSLEALKAGLFQTLPPEEQKTAAFPKETSLQAARENLVATILSREGIAKDTLAERERASRAIEDLRRDALTQQHDRLLSETDYKKEQIKSRNKMIDIIGGAKKTIEEQKYEDKLTKALENVTLYQDDPDKAYSHAQNFNSILAVAKTKFPETIGQEYTPFRLTPRVEGRIWDTKPTITPGVKEEGGKGTTTTAPLTFPRRVRVNGEETIVNSQDEYDALKRGLSK